MVLSMAKNEFQNLPTKIGFCSFNIDGLKFRMEVSRFKRVGLRPFSDLVDVRVVGTGHVQQGVLV